MKRCPGCKQLFPLAEYLTRKGAHAASQGRVGRPYGYCLTCRRMQRDGNPHKFWIHLVASAKKRRGSTITPADLAKLYEQQDKRCALTGVELTFIHGSGQVWTNVSIDRIDNTKDYDIDNVRLVTYAANVARNAMSDATFLAFCQRFLQHQSPLKKATRLNFKRKL